MNVEDVATNGFHVKNKDQESVQAACQLIGTSQENNKKDQEMTLTKELKERLDKIPLEILQEILDKHTKQSE